MTVSVGIEKAIMVGLTTIDGLITQLVHQVFKKHLEEFHADTRGICNNNEGWLARSACKTENKIDLQDSAINLYAFDPQENIEENKDR